MKTLVKAAFDRLGFEIHRKPEPGPGIGPIPDAEFYDPMFSPWKGYGAFKAFYEKAAPYTLVSADRCHVIYTLASQALQLHGDFWECGVYKGGTAILLAELIAAHPQARTRLHLFDSFSGMPETDPYRDLHRRGEFADTSLDAVRARVGREEIAVFHPGFIPDTFHGLEGAKIAFAHVDVDLYQSILDCCRFIMPRLVTGGFVVFDDYGWHYCPGARQAIDEFFRDRPEKPLVLPTGQAVVFASGAPVQLAAVPQS